MQFPSFVQGVRRVTAPRVLLYSHDTFGLGHLRRSRAISQALVAAIPDLSALILTGSPVAGRFAFPEGVDHVRLPGVVKQTDGEYLSQSLRLHIDKTTALRSRLIEAAVEGFAPDLMIVDKEPTGFRGELLRTLEKMRTRRSVKVVLGVRDVLDDPETIGEEWRRKGALTAAESYYDELWVYGLRDIYDPFNGLDPSKRLQKRTHFTGYLKREIPSDSVGMQIEQPYVLITPGGGGDGASLVDWALSAYESDPSLEPKAVIVYGPFLSGEVRAGFDARVEALDGRVEAYGFVSNMETLMRDAMGVVAMGGYNTFCEVLSFDKPTLLAPRTVPRREQQIRAAAAETLGLVRMLDRERDGDTPQAMAQAIRSLATQPPPSAQNIPGMLDGFDEIVIRARTLLGMRPEDGRRSLAEAV